MEDVGIFYGHLVNFTTIWYTSWTFGIFCGHCMVGIFSPFWYAVPIKIWQPRVTHDRRIGSRIRVVCGVIVTCRQTKMGLLASTITSNPSAKILYSTLKNALDY
jgi:hypothetical protein